MASVAEARPQPIDQFKLEQRIRLRHLRVLLAISDRGGITRAAERLGVTQAAVSKVVAEIEGIVGMPIFERQGRTVALTQAGDFALTAARHIATEVHVLAENLALLREGAIGVVSIGMQAISTQFLLAKAIADLKRQWPRATVHIIDGLLPELLGDLRDGRLDLVIGRIEPEAMNPDLAGFAMISDPTIVTAACHHPVLQKTVLTWADVAKEAWCLPLPGTPMRDHFDHLLQVMGFDPPVNIVECGSVSQIVMIQREMRCFSIAPQALAEHWAEIGMVATTKLVVPSLSAPIGLIWSKRLALGPTARMFRQIVARRQEEETGHQVAPIWIDQFFAATALGEAADGLVPIPGGQAMRATAVEPGSRRR